MRHWLSFTLARSFLVLVIMTSCVQANDACESLANSKMEALSTYVKQKYHLSMDVTVLPRNVSFVEGTCYRRIRFTSTSDKRQGLTLSLFLSPDQRFLSKDLLDSTKDPDQEEANANERLQMALVENNPPSLGPKDAPIVISVFSDFQCPYCKKQAELLRSDVLPSEHRVRLVFHHLPLPMHSWSRKAAAAAVCAARQSNDAFWAVHDFLFDHQDELGLENVNARIEQFFERRSDIDSKKFELCLEKNEWSAIVESDITLARDNGIQSTPTVFVNSHRINGLAPSEQLRTLVRQLTEAELSGAKMASESR